MVLGFAVCYLYSKILQTVAQRTCSTGSALFDVTMARSEGPRAAPSVPPRFLQSEGAVKTSDGARHTLHGFRVIRTLGMSSATQRKQSSVNV